MGAALERGRRVSTARSLRALAIVFALYQVARALTWPQGAPPGFGLLVASVAVYVVVTLAAILMPPPSPTEHDGLPPLSPPLPAWVAAAAVALCAVLPTVTGIALSPEPGPASLVGTWYVGGLGILLVVLVVRRRVSFAIAGAVLLVVGAMAWMTPGVALTRGGLIGSLLWIIVAYLTMRLLERARRDSLALQRVEAAASAIEAAQAGRESERRTQIQRALAVAGGVLGRVIARAGAIDAVDRAEAGRAEARLRDELRGARLLDDDVRDALDAARARGALVSVLDEGGLDTLDDGGLDVVRNEIARTVRASEAERLIVRTSTHARIAVTIVGRSEDDEENVDLWVEIARPGAS